MGFIFRCFLGGLGEVWNEGLMAVLCCVVGLIGGVAVSTFSKTLALLFGLVVVGVQVSAVEIFVWLGLREWGRLIGSSFWLREDIISLLRHGYRNM